MKKIKIIIVLSLLTTLCININFNSKVYAATVPTASLDVNNDYIIDIKDLAAVSSKYNIKKSDSTYNTKYDLNKDGLIDLYDMTLLSKQIGTSIPKPSVNTKKGYVYNPELQIDLKIRSAPNLNGTILGYLYNYQKVNIVDTLSDAKGNVWDKIIYNNSFAYVYGAYIQSYTSPPDSVVNIARNITKRFEVGNSNEIAGNFDGAGLSLGYLQWCIGQGTLQPLLNRMDRQHTNEMKSIFGTNYNSIHNMILDTPENQLKWAKSINDSTNKIKAPWYSQFNNLCNNKDFISIESDAEVSMIKQAMSMCDKYNLKTVRGFALAFDIVTQNGSISPAAEKIITTNFIANPNMSEKNMIKLIANAVADSSTGNIEDIRSRKTAIATGTGIVHGSNLYLDRDYGLSDNKWR
ncbi:MAG: SH3 domain-containing protein [Clostridium sp.]|uniref:SH3 domain-containing protein n=1 Tax=Clostridium sp. TaxID=1506 RepID=UPI0039EC3039